MTVAVDGRRCCFAEAIGARVARCAKARKSVREYRRLAHCVDADAHARCAAWLERVRAVSRFTLGSPRAPSALSRSGARKLQCGGLLGMGEVLEGVSVTRIEDVYRLLSRAMARHESLERVPLQPVIRRVQEYDAGND